jgi:integrin alpha FG-GAP repeat containing protein 1
VNAIPADFNHDGRLDLLLMTEKKEGGWWNGNQATTSMLVHLGAGNGEYRKSPLHLTVSAHSH